MVGPMLVGALLARPVRAGEPDLGDLELSVRGEFIASYLHLDEIDVDPASPVIQPEEAGNLWTVGGRGALDAALGILHAQVEFSGEGTVHNRDADDTYLGSFGGGLHAGLRNPELGSIGVFGAGGNLGINGVDEPDRSTVAWGVGGEGQLFFDPVTLYLQAGYLDREAIPQGGDPNVLKNAGFVRLVGRYFPLDDLELEVEGSYAQGKIDPDADKLFLPGWGAGVEARIPGTPLAGFVQYTGAFYYQADDTDKLFEHRIGFGLRVYFGQPTLKANDRHGVSLDLPRNLEWSGVTAGPLE
jgi:hypothetical protein